MKRPEVVTGIALDAEEIHARIERLARDVVKTYRAGSRVLMVVILEGARQFARDLTYELLKYTSARFEIGYITARSYHGGRKSGGKVEVDDATLGDVAGREILLVDDVYDSGLTLRAVTEHLLSRGARKVKTCVFLEKRRAHEAPAAIDHLGATVEDRFLIGYGLDLGGAYRDLPYVAYADERC